MARKEELKRFEESLVVRSAAMEERHRALEAREMSLQARDQGNAEEIELCGGDAQGSMG
jgi:hypothetical protein